MLPIDNKTEDCTSSFVVVVVKQKTSFTHKVQYYLTTISLVPVPASDARLDLVFVFYMGIIFARWKLHGIMRDWWSSKSFGKFITKLLFLGMYETNRAKHFVIQLVPPIQLCSTPLSDLWVILGPLGLSHRTVS